MTKKFWFQLAIGIILSLIIVRFLVEIKWIFSPFIIILKTILLPVLLGGVLFYITVPIQTLLEKRKIPRWLTIGVIFLILIGFIWLVVEIIGPPVAEQVTNLVDHTPMIANEINNLIQEVKAFENLPSWVEKEINNALDSLAAISALFGKWIVSFFQSVIQGTLVLILTPFFLLFMLKDHEKFIPTITHFFQGKKKSWLENTFKDIDEVLRLYIQGQILISFILGLMLYIGYLIIGLNYGLLLALFAFFMNVIPFIGPWIAFVPALIIGVIQDPMMVLWVSLTTLIAQQIDANLITPNIMGKQLKIHPLTIITILLAAGKIGGFLGILIAVPAYAVGKAIVSNIYAYRQSIKEAATRDV